VLGTAFGRSVNLKAAPGVKLTSRGFCLIADQEIEDFVTTSLPRLVAGLTVMTGSRAAAEDVVCEALARAWERSARGEHIESLPAWVTTVATNLARSGVRRLRTELRWRRSAQRNDGPDADEVADVSRAVRALPRRQREAAVLHYYLDLDVVEVARLLGVSEGTVKTNLFRARHKLALALGLGQTEEIAHGR
jgi:RNA polymerase sigma-70 factor (ECF subfamily)